MPPSLTKGRILRITTMKKEVKKLMELIDEELIAEFHRVYKLYFYSIKNMNLYDLHGIPDFAKAKDELRLVSREIKRRGIVIKAR
jgi:hypothetical protein